MSDQTPGEPEMLFIKDLDFVYAPPYYLWYGIMKKRMLTV